MKKHSAYTKIKINWRAMWYSVLVWLLAIVVSSVVILPWYYLVLPFAVFWTTVIYFRSGDRQSLSENNSFERGLWIALFWFAIVAGLDILEIIGPYYKNAFLYFSDFRNWLKYVLILLIPAIYGLVQENIKLKKTFKGKFPQEFSQELPTEA